MKTRMVVCPCLVYLGLAAPLCAAGIGGTFVYPGELGMAIVDPQSLSFSENESGINSLGQSFSWSLSGSGQLTAGELKAKAQTFNSGETRVLLMLTDQLIATGPAMTGLTAILEMDVDGSSSVNPLCECNNSVLMNTYLRGDFGPNELYQSSFTYLYRLNNIGMGGTEFWRHDPGGDVEIRTDAKLSFDFTLRISVPMFIGPNGLSNGLNLTQFLDVGASQVASGSAAIDVSNTAKLRVILPDGYSFTSQSGLLLTEPPASAVPEPRAFLLWVAGLAVLGLRRLGCGPRDSSGR